ncbi:MAG: hypothetical protein ABI772_14360, partial [Bacteroidota bacterium]
MKLYITVLFSFLFCCSEAQVFKTKLLTGNNNEAAFKIISSYDGGFIVSGYTKSYTHGDRDIYVAKYDHDLNLQWTKSIGTAALEFPEGIIETSAHEILMAFNNCNAGICDIVLTKMDESGNILWNKSYYYYEDNYSIDLRETPGKNYAVLSKEGSLDAGSRIMLTDTAGNIISTKAIETTAHINSRFASALPDGFIIFGGSYLVLTTGQ